MKLLDVIQKLSDAKINKNAVDEVETKYRVTLPEDVKKLLSAHSETLFYDDFPLLRGLSNIEILDASSDMGVDFVGIHLLPLFDMGDNDYIVYDLTECCWYKFNIVEELKFGRANKLEEYLLSNP